jgi:hypothetical protein
MTPVESGRRSIRATRGGHGRAAGAGAIASGGGAAARQNGPGVCSRTRRRGAGVGCACMTGTRLVAGADEASNMALERTAGLSRFDAGQEQ